MKTWDPDALALLEEEERVLLRDVTELDAQLAAGELAPEQHAALRDELTLRAVEVMDRRARRQAERPRPVRRRGLPLVIAAVVLAAAGAAFVLTSQLAPRVPPQATISADGSIEDRLARLAQVVDERPEDGPARLAYARLLIQGEDLPGALEQFDAVASLDPANAEALAYGGWLAALGGDVEAGIDRLERAVAADGAYPDAHALLGLARMRAGDEAGAVAELTRYLDLAPDGPLAEQVAAVIARLGGGP